MDKLVRNPYFASRDYAEGKTSLFGQRIEREPAKNKGFFKNLSRKYKNFLHSLLTLVICTLALLLKSSEMGRCPSG